MKKNIFSAILMAMLVLFTPLYFTSCQVEELDTNQYTGELKILSFGPSPVARGGKLHIMGSGMSSVKSVVFPTNLEVKDIEVVSNEEIVVVVPMEAQPGYITVKADGKEATSSSRISYTEPVGFAAEGAITPNPVKPGEVLTIKGTYLNLVQQIIFEKGVVVEVPNEDRTKTAEEIKVVVPVEARTGKISLAFAATGDTLLNEVPSKEVVEVVLPSVKQIAELKETKPGDVITVIGKDFDLVVAMLGTSDDTLAYTVNAEFTELSFAVPANVSNGVINVVTASGVKVPVATIGVALPKQLALDKNEEVRAGDILTISGKDLELVTTITFPSVKDPVEAEMKSGRTATEIKVVVPAEAVTGSIVLNTAAGVSVDAALESGLAYTTLKPTFKNYGVAELPLGGDVVIYGTDLDLVAKVLFTGGASVEEFEASANVLNIKMPVLNVETGALTLVMSNGEEVALPSLTVNAPEFCYITAWPTLEDGELLQAGSVLIVTTENADRLVGVVFNDQPTQFMVNDKLVYILTPYNGKPGSKFVLVSDNGEIEYTYDLKPNTEIETVIWTGMETVAGWSGSLSALSWGGYDWSTVAEGMELRIYYQLNPAAEYTPVMRAGNGSWVALPTWKTLPGADGDGNVPVDGSEKFLSITLTQADLDQLVNNGGLVVCGAWFIVTKVSLVEHVSLEETVWKGSEVCDGWSGVGFLEDGAADLLAAGLKVGSVVRFYVTPTEDAWNCQITEGHWGPKWTDYNQDNYDLAENKGAIVLTITQEIYDLLVTPQDWGNAFIINADNLICTKITIE